MFCTGLTEQQGQDKNLLYWHDEANEQIKEGPPSFVLHKSSFASVSTVSRGYRSLVTLVIKNSDFCRNPNAENSLGPISNPDSIVDTMSLKTDQ